MYKNKIYESAYHSKENYMVYNFHVRHFFVKQFESSSGLKVILLHFDPLKLQKKQQQIIKL